MDMPDLDQKELEEDLRRIRLGLPQRGGYADREAEKAKREAAQAAAAAEKEATAESAADQERIRQLNESLPSGHSIAATAWSASHIRVYFQDGQGGVREARHDNGIWSGANAQSVLFKTKLRTPLSVINWNSGQQIRIYYISYQDTLQEYCYSAGSGWYHGNLNKRNVRVAPYSKISAIEWPVDTSIRVYFQGKFLTHHPPTSDAIQEYCHSGQNGWSRGSTLSAAQSGSSIATTRWISGTLDHVHRNLNIRIYYQDGQSYIKELCWKFGGWSTGGFSQPVSVDTPLAAFAWFDSQINICLFWKNRYEQLFESKYSSQGWIPGYNIVNKVDGRSSFAAIELQNGISHRVYVREPKDLVEKCSSSGGYWSNGAFVVK